MRLSPSFILQELVNPEIHKAWGDLCANFVRPCLVEVLQLLRDEAGPLLVNNWHLDGPYIDSGLRHPTLSVGAELSAHKFGTTADVKPLETTTDHLLEIVTSQPALFNSVVRIEDLEYTRTSRGKLGRDWFHVETGARRGNIIVFKP